MTLEIELCEKDPKVLILTWDGDHFRKVSKSMFLSELKKIPPHLSRQEFLQLFSQIEEKVGKRYALYLLSQRALLSSELSAKLIAKGLSSLAANTIAEHCVAQGYIDDTHLVSRLVARELRKGHSARAVLFKLKQKKGIPEKVLRAHLQSAEQSESQVLEKWIEKNARKIDRNDPVAMRKVMAKLIRRGFPSELVFQTFIPK